MAKPCTSNVEWYFGRPHAFVHSKRPFRQCRPIIARSGVHDDQANPYRADVESIAVRPDPYRPSPDSISGQPNHVGCSFGPARAISVLDRTNTGQHKSIEDPFRIHIGPTRSVSAPTRAHVGASQSSLGRCRIHVGSRHPYGIIWLYPIPIQVGCKRFGIRHGFD